MKSFHFVKLNPSGNTTGLILEKTAQQDRSSLAASMMTSASLGTEQIAFADFPGPEPCDYSLAMMGGEFCGNAVRSAAAWMAFDRMRWQPEEITAQSVRSYSVACSGAEGIFSCQVKPIDECRFYVSSQMPHPTSVRTEVIDGRTWGCVAFQGIVHYICTEPADEAGRSGIVADMLRRTDHVPQGARGVLFWNSGVLDPWVYVSKTNTLCRETSCGSGSAAVGAWEAYTGRKKEGKTAVRQKGGLIDVSYAADHSGISICIGGEVKIEAEGIVYLS